MISQLGENLRYVCTINEANMGMQVAAVAKRYMVQMPSRFMDLKTAREQFRWG